MWTLTLLFKSGAGLVLGFIAFLSYKMLESCYGAPLTFPSSPGRPLGRHWRKLCWQKYPCNWSPTSRPKDGPQSSHFHSQPRALPRFPRPRFPWRVGCGQSSRSVCASAHPCTHPSASTLYFILLYLLLLLLLLIPHTYPWSPSFNKDQ